MRLVREATVLALIGLDGCSFIGVHPASSPLVEDTGRPERRTCTDDYGLPLFDALVTAVSITASAQALTAKGNSSGIVGIPLVLPYLFSTVYGLDQVNDCKTALSETDPRTVRRHALAVNAWQLTNVATSASRSGDCMTVKRLEPQIARADPNLHASLVLDADIARCLAASDATEALAATPYCFDETADGLAATVCMPSEFRCNATVSGLPLGSVATSCRQASTDAVGTQNPAARDAPDSTSVAEAQRWIESGTAGMTAGRYEDAAYDFGAAYALTHDPELLHQIADANVGAGKCPTASAYYTRYLREAKLDARGVAMIRERIASCKVSP